MNQQLVEWHPLEVTTGHTCPACESMTMVQAVLAFARCDTLEVIGHTTGVECTLCGFTLEHNW